MERYTEWMDNHRHGAGLPGRDCYTRLAELEDMIEKGLLIEAPCKVGDTVFGIVNFKIVEDVVDRIEINKCCRKISTVKHSWLCNFENVFLSREEAEQEIMRRNREKEPWEATNE